MKISPKNSSWQILAYSLISSSLIYANPTDPSVIHGTAQFDNIDARTLSITTSDKAIINWNDFSIAEAELTQFIQPTSKSIVVNQVTGDLSSILLGTLKANGKLFLLNPHGILVGENAYIDTNSFIASSLPVCCPYALIDGQEEAYFQGESNASIINLGRIKAWDGDVVLISYQIENKGAIDAFNGTVALAAGKEVILQPLGPERIAVRPSQERYASSDTGIENAGWITSCQAELKADGNAYGLAIRHAGFIDATGIAEKNGEVYLVTENGNNAVLGAIAAENANGTGGKVHILGENITLFKSANIDASGDNGGGEILIGGDQSGANPSVLNAKTTFIEDGAIIYADAIENGNGGQVIVWADDTTAFYGEISARGGEFSGNGGFVEVSGKQNLIFEGTADRLAPNGQAGTLLLDPIDLNVIAPDQQVTVVSPIGPNATGCTAQISPATILANLLLGNVIVESSGSGFCTQNGDLTISSAVAIPGANVNNLLFRTRSTTVPGVTVGSIRVNAPVTNSGSGTLTFESVQDIFVNSPLNAPSPAGLTTIDANRNVHINQTIDTGTALSGSPLVITAGQDIHVTSTITVNSSTINMTTTSGDIYIDGLIQEIFTPFNMVMTSGRDIFATDSVSINGGLTVTAARDIILQRGSSAAAFVTVVAGRRIELNGSGPNCCGGALTCGNGFLSITAQNNIDLFATNYGATIDGSAGTLVTSLTGDINVLGGPTPGSATALIRDTSVTLPLTVNVPNGNLNVISGTGPGCFAAVTGITGANINVAKTVYVSCLQGGDSSADATINTAIGALNITADKLIVESGPLANALIRSHILTFGHDISITTVNDVILRNTGSSIQNGGNTTHFISVIAGTNINMDPGTSIKNGTNNGSVTLVVDNQFPTPPSAGTGAFIGQGAVSTTAGGPLRIFTSRRQYNSIPGTLNGGPFVPGPMLVNSATEQWSVWYPSAFGGTPYTIFYKYPDIQPPIPPDLLQRALTLFNQAAYEFLQDLRDYDFFWYWKTLYTCDYDHAEYDRVHAKDTVQSSDVIGKTTYKLLRKTYKENNGKLVNLLK